MRSTTIRSKSALAAFALLIAACGGDAAVDTTVPLPGDTDSSTTTTLPVVPVTTSTTIPLIAGGPALIREGDRNETVEAFQWLINCNGYGDLTVDGVFGPGTLAAVQATQTALGRVSDGAPDEETLAELARACSEIRMLEVDAYGAFRVVGNAGPGDPEEFSLPLVLNSRLTVEVTTGTGATVLVHGADGLIPASPTEGSWDIETTQDYVIEVSSDIDPVTFTLTVDVSETTPETGEWVLAGDGATFATTKLKLGDDAQTVIDKIYDIFDHGIRGRYDEFDTDWYVNDAGDLGLRGIAIGGFAFLFFGPSPANSTRAETLVRIRFEGSNPDGDGEPRPDNYVTTAAGITVGDTLADLKAAYGDQAKSGSNATEHYYKLSDSGGTLCFYFGASAPTNTSTIREIATECRS